MTTLSADPSVRPSLTPAQRLRTTTAAVRVSFTWFGVRKTLTRDQKAQAAESFGAEGQFLSAGKKLLDTRHPAFRAVTGIRGQAIHYWKGMTLPYPEPGIRLIRQDQIESFDQRIEEFQADLATAVQRLNEQYDELKQAARRRLGTLFNAGDYPLSLDGLFAIDREYPSVEPPDYLMRLHPRLFEEQQHRLEARFAEAVQLAEQAFMQEFGQLVSHLCERLSGQNGGQKVFRDSAVSNLAEFFDRFRQLNVRSNEDLDRLVDNAQRLVHGIEPQTLRTDASLRECIAAELSEVESQLQELLVDRPRRRILRGVINQESRS